MRPLQTDLQMLDATPPIERYRHNVWPWSRSVGCWALRVRTGQPL